MILKTFSIFLLFQGLAYAQYSVAPSGSIGSGAPPVGENESSACQFGNCSFELKLRPFCFGANLRSYPVSGQLKSTGDITIGLTFTDSASPSKKDVINVSFPPSLTFNKKDVKIICTFTTSPDGAGTRNMKCPLPTGDADYRLSGWLKTTNPVTGYNNSSYPFTMYSGILLDATKINSAAGEQNIRCFYRFTQDWRDGRLISDSVACYFPNSSGDEKDKVLVKNASGIDIPVTEKSAFTNDIRIILRDRLNSLPSGVPVKNGEIQVGSPPNQTLDFKQNKVAIFNNIKKNEFNKATAYQSYSLEVGFPGEAGFCGGFYSPLMLFFDDQRPSFTGITRFPLYGKNPGAANYWPEKNAPGFFLVHLKKDQKSVEDYHNLFGKNDDFQNGFEALRAHDSNKDDVIDSKDPVFKELKLWGDKNADGFSSKEELFSLKEKGITKIDLNYSVNDRVSFGDKATAREKGSFTFKMGKNTRKGEILDVWFNSLD